MDDQAAETASDAFALGDLWKPSVFTVPKDVGTQPLIQLDSDLDVIRGPSSFTPPPSEWLLLPELKPFGYKPENEPLQLESSACSTPSDLDSCDATKPLDVNFFDDNFFDDNFFDEVVAEIPRAHAPSWDLFHNGHVRRKPIYLSELPPQAFDAVLCQARKSNQSPRILKLDVAFKALILLGLGMESALYEYRLVDKTFMPLIPEARTSSLSNEAHDSLARKISKTGSLFRKLRTELQTILTSRRPSPTHVALASALSVLVNELYGILLHDLEYCKSTLLLQSTLERPGALLEVVHLLLQHSEAVTGDGAILSNLCTSVENAASANPWLGPLLHQVLIGTTSAWLATVSTIIGLQDATIHSRSIVDAVNLQAERFAEAELGSDVSDTFPSFLDQEDRDAILEACACLNMLRNHDEGHILVHYPRYQCTDPPALIWSLHWSQLQQMQAEALRYDSEIRKISPLTKITAWPEQAPPTDNQGSAAIDPYIIPEAELRDAYQLSVDKIEGSPHHQDLHHELVRELRKVVHRENHQSYPSQHIDPILALHLSLSPALTVQNGLLNRACLRLMLDKFNLREHFLVHYRYHLFGDGLFAARLSEALFSANTLGAEGRDRHARPGTLGLQLEGRSSWPPGGPELRLVLMDVLTDSYFGASADSKAESKELPGNLSFGIRSLSEPEIRAVMDSSSLNALDFLRLKYVPSPPLHMIFTESALEKYDAIFKLLLRLSRLLAITKQLTPTRNSKADEDSTTAGFRIAALRFVNALSSYFLQFGIATPWSRFLAQVAALESGLQDGADHASSHLDSVFALRKAHEQMLDTVLFSLLLRKRQAPVINLLEDIFGVILSFAKTKAMHTKGADDRKEEIRGLYQSLREKVGVFLAVCRGLSERKGYGTRVVEQKGVVGEVGIEQLVQMLDMNGWWASKGR